MAPIRYVSRRLVTLLSVRHACAADLAATPFRGVATIAWHAPPVAPWRSAAPRSFANGFRSTHRGFTASARARAKAPSTAEASSSTQTSRASRTETVAGSAVPETTDAKEKKNEKREDRKPSDPERGDAPNPLAGMMFPWERAVLSGDRDKEPMGITQKVYWAAFAIAVALLVANRIRVSLRNRKTKEEEAVELAKNRAAMQRALEGNSFAGEEDPFEGMEPHEIEAFLKKEAPDGDPYVGMTPEEINEYLHEQQEKSVRENVSVPKLATQGKTKQ
jgi:hypothetical protein